MTDEYDQQRQRFRVRYPNAARPVLEIRGGSLTVLDCSESGLRFEVPEGMISPAVGSAISGTLKLNEGREVEVAAVVHGVYPDGVALRFTSAGVPYKVIFAEQRFLRKHFGY